MPTPLQDQTRPDNSRRGSFVSSWGVVVQHSHIYSQRHCLRSKLPLIFPVGEWVTLSATAAIL